MGDLEAAGDPLDLLLRSATTGNRNQRPYTKHGKTMQPRQACFAFGFVSHSESDKKELWYKHNTTSGVSLRRIKGLLCGFQSQFRHHSRCHGHGTGSPWCPEALGGQALADGTCAKGGTQ